ncbi:MAG TPA: discoidin domain-containing protein [Microlunatus sp.]|nr:discoidin domain-containing protein [Microlunatus sp.]
MATGSVQRRGAAFGLSLALALSAVVAAESTSMAASGGWSPGVESWVTDLAGEQRLTPQPPISWESGRGHARSRIVVDPTRRYQSMTGFGASMTDSSAYVLSQLSPDERARTMRELFSPTEGIGLSMLRQPMGASDFAVQRPYSYDDQPAGQTDPELLDFSIDHDRGYILPRLREAFDLNPDLTFMATPWSAPGWMKTSDSLIGGQLRPEYEQAYAQYFVKFIQAYREAGIPTDYVSMQNEPLYQPDDYPGMEVLPPQQAEFIAARLTPALRSAGLQAKVLAYDHNWDIPDYPEAVHGAIGPYTAGTAWHCYAGEAVTQSVSHNDYPHAQSFQTECSGGDWQGDRTTAFALSMDSVIDVPRNWGQSVVLWNLALDGTHGPHTGGCTNCRGLVTTRSDGTVVKEPDYWALGQVSRFVRPGALRVGSSSLAGGGSVGVRDVAFQNPDGSLILVAHNSASTARSFDVVVGGRHFSDRLASGAAVTYRWRAPADLPPAGGLGFVDLDFGPGPAGTPTGRLTQSVNPDVVDHLNQVSLGRHWLVYSQPYGATIERTAPAVTLPRRDWTFHSTGTVDVTAAPPANMVDDKPGTRWTSGAAQSTKLSLTVDLGRRQTFTEISLDTGASIGDYLRRYRVQISTGGQRWRTVARGPGHTGVMTIPLPPTRARYLRLVSEAKSTSWWTIEDLQLRNTPNPGPVEPPGRDLISDEAQLHGTTLTGYYNAGTTPAVAPWPVDTFPYTYRLPPTAAVTFGVVTRRP